MNVEPNLVSNSRRSVFVKVVLFSWSSALLSRHASTTAGGAGASIIAQTVYGSVEGQIIENEDGFQIQAYRGVRFAKAPIGDLRFKPPETPSIWKTPMPAKAWPKACIQTDIFAPQHSKSSSSAEKGAPKPTDATQGGAFHTGDKESEDCLFLNVFAPLAKTTAYPVMVWIYGGGFYVGNTEHYGMVGINKRLVPKGVVMVTIQYRLGAFGFLSTGDSEVPGNAGLLDQTFALQWIRENIRNFNGNPDSVTVFGNSAGAGSASLLSLSPISRDLFHQVILMSGSSHAPWVLSDNQPVRITKRIARHLNCDTSSSALLVHCLQQKQPSEIVAASLADVMNDYAREELLEKLGFEFTPMVDGQFLPKSINKLLHEAPPKRLMTGLTSNEMNVFVAPFLENFGSKWSLYGKAELPLRNFTQALSELLPDSKYKSAQLLQRIGRNYYLESVGDSSNQTFVAEQFIRLLGDATMYAPSFENAIQSAANGWTVFAYLFDYYADDLMPTEYRFRGSGHSMDLAYLFETPMWTTKPIKFSSEEEQVADLMATIWTNFAKFGDPGISDLKRNRWAPIASSAGEGEIIYFQISLNSTVEASGWLRRAAAFWSKLVPEVEAYFAQPNKPLNREEL